MPVLTYCPLRICWPTDHQLNTPIVALLSLFLEAPLVSPKQVHSYYVCLITQQICMNAACICPSIFSQSMCSVYVCVSSWLCSLHLPWAYLLSGEYLLQGVKHGKGHAGGELSDGCLPLTGPRGSCVAWESPRGKREEERGLRVMCTMLPWPHL